MQSVEEWKHFEDHYMNYQDKSVGTADNYSFVNWSEFAKDWCEKVGIEEQQGKTSSFTYKNAALLKDAWKEYLRRTNRATTMLGHDTAAKDLRARLQDTSTPTVRNLEFPDNQIAGSVAVPIGRRATVDTLFEDKSSDPSVLLPAQGSKRKRKRKKKDKSAPTTHHRCRKCGQEFNVDPWKELHKPQDSPVETDSIKPKAGNLNYQEGNKPSDNCRVPVNQYASPEFPCLTGKMPRRK